jgi:hypothetical protein
MIQVVRLVFLNYEVSHVTIDLHMHKEGRRVRFRNNSEDFAFPGK